MKQILVLIENELEQSITGDILRSGLGAEAEITLTAGAEQAIQQLQSGAVDLFIADVERFDVAHCNMVTTARKTAPDTPILVTSVGTQEEIAGYVWRLGVRDYLLKPYRPTWLLAAVRALVRKERSGGCAADQQEIYLRRLTDPHECGPLCGGSGESRNPVQQDHPVEAVGKSGALSGPL